MAMVVQATTAPSPPEGMLLMLAFGAGTLPSMLSASVLFGKLGPRLRGWLLKGAALFVMPSASRRSGRACAIFW
jgi:sulfite exporter TauE/SafE